LETGVRNRFPLPTSLKQLAYVLQEDWYKIPQETVQNLCESISRMIAASWRQNVAQYPINKEICTVPVVFLYFLQSLYMYRIRALFNKISCILCYTLPLKMFCTAMKPEWS
jgi:hypothetical protein